MSESADAPARSVRRRRLLALALLIPIVIATAAWAVTYTPLFDAKHVRVEGAVSLRPDDVRALAKVSPSTNVFHLQPDAVTARLLTDPWIASATVAKDLPDTVVLTVVERRPVGVIDAMGERSVLASDGTLLPASAATDQTINGLPSVQAGLGAPDDTQRAAAAAMLSALDPVVEQRVTDLTVGGDLNETLTLRDGVTVDAGTPGDEAAKATALRAVLRWAAGGGHALATVDVSAPEAPSATLPDGSTLSP
ncbi:MAG TPA: FtsQ-type POTRA domain-containing protein [Actinomycetota bacterium]|jgi:cell division protein FtsQ|nr:FtsQ-type POTRA domain-containing protein [Actinomycetota bacterium]